jgi:lactate permease
MSGFRKSVEVLPAILVSGCSFALIQWFSSNYIGPALPDVLAGIGSILSLIIFLKYWKPKNTWRFPNEAVPTISGAISYTNGQILRAWSPFLLLTVIIIAWGIQPIKDVLNSFGQIQFEFPGLHNIIIDKSGNPIPHIFKFNFLSASGTAILLSAIISIPLVGLRFADAARIFLKTIMQLKFPIITVATVLGFAYIVNDSGIAITMAEALANTGFLFPFFAPMLGWLGVFITGSDTSANALFGKLQAATATSIGVDPVVTVAANVSGGVIGKMISPQSIAIAAAAGSLVGKESELFRFTVKHSFIMLLFICLIVLGQAYIFQWIIPEYQVISSKNTVSTQNLFKGYMYMFVLALVIAVIAVAVRKMTKKPRVFDKIEAI